VGIIESVLNTSNYILSTSNDIVNISNILQFQINQKQSNIIGAASSITFSNLIPNRSLISDIYGKIIESSITTTEINYLNGAGITKKFIDNNIYNNDLTVTGTLNASNLNITGATTYINTSTYQTENIEIISSSPDGPALKIVQNGIQNIVDIYDASNNVLCIKDGGNIGIGNTAPIEKIDITGNIKLSGNINGISSNEISFIKGITSPIQTQINNKEPLITVLPVSKGGIGISTIAANKLLGSSGSQNVIQAISIGNGLSLSSGTLSASLVASQWVTNDSNIYYNSGNVGIGITNPFTGLHISSTNVNQQAIVSDGNNTNCQLLIGTNNNSGNQYSSIQSILQGTGYKILSLNPSGGNVGIGTTNPVSALHVNGSITATGNVTAYYSDERLKTKTGIINDPFYIIDNINVFYYKANNIANNYGFNDEKIEIGVSAQDVQKVLPEIVTLAPFDSSNLSTGELISKSGSNYLTINYDRLTPVLIESVKELKKEINLIKEMFYTKELEYINKIKEYNVYIQELKNEIENIKK
jgi:hypothetical protein